MAGTLSIHITRLGLHRMGNISHIPKLITSKLGISVQFCRHLAFNVKLCTKRWQSMAGTLSIHITRLRWHRMANISHIPKFILDKLGISVGFCPYLTLNAKL